MSLRKVFSSVVFAIAALTIWGCSHTVISTSTASQTNPLPNAPEQPATGTLWQTADVAPSVSQQLRVAAPSESVSLNRPSPSPSPQTISLGNLFASENTTSDDEGSDDLPSSSSDPRLSLTDQQLIDISWEAYRDRFIQGDGRVIDWEANARTVSEGQAYALLQAVWHDDITTFERVLNWAEQNLVRTASGVQQEVERVRQEALSQGAEVPEVLPQSPADDHLWAWIWGQQADGSWGIIDINFATDADIDAVTALILADRLWNRPQYRQLALEKLADIWQQGTRLSISGEWRLLLPGPEFAFSEENERLVLNPSYYAPYAFRLFAQVDSQRDWQSLVDSSYHVWNSADQVSTVDLPSDWVDFDGLSSRFSPTNINDRLTSKYSFDAFRVWWRAVLDARWFGEPRAISYLDKHLAHIQQLWQQQQAVPAAISIRGTPLVPYESTAQYGMLYAAFSLTNAEIATEIRQTKLIPQFQEGIWDNPEAYYTQNLVSLGLLASTTPPALTLPPP